MSNFPGSQHGFAVPPWPSWGFKGGETAVEFCALASLECAKPVLMMCILLVFQHAEETRAAGSGRGPAISIPLPRTDCTQLPEPKGDEGPGPAWAGSRGTTEDVAGGCPEPGLGEVSVGVAGPGQHPYIPLLTPTDRPPAQQHALPHLQDNRAHLIPWPAQLQCLHPVSQQGLQPVRLQPQPAPYPGNSSSASGSLPSRFGWVVGWLLAGFARRGSCFLQAYKLHLWLRQLQSIDQERGLCWLIRE